MMKLTIIQPAGILEEMDVSSINAEGREGAFGVYPRHIDYVTVLRVGILTAMEPSGQERFFAVDGGVLVKAGDDVRVSTPRVTESASLEDLREDVALQEAAETEAEKKNRSMVTGLEAALITGFVNL